MHDSMTNRPRGFGFVTFDLEESVGNIMQKTFHELDGRLVEVKRAMPKEEINGGTGSYNTRFGGRNGSSYNNSLTFNYPPYSPGYGVPPHYASLPVYSGVGQYTSGAGVFGSCYPMSAYGLVLWLLLLPLGITGNGPVMIRAGAYPLPYGNAYFSPVYMNSGVGLMGMVAGGYNGIVGAEADGKLIQVLGGDGHFLYSAAPPQIEGVKLDVDFTGLKGGNVGASVEQNQKGLDGRFKPLPVVISR